jgi:hypothetical protein
MTREQELEIVEIATTAVVDAIVKYLSPLGEIKKDDLRDFKFIIGLEMHSVINSIFGEYE